MCGYQFFKIKFIFLLSFVFSSCSFFNEPVKEFFKEYTETAAIEKIEYSVPTRVDKDGNICISSDEDLSCFLYMRNPQVYDVALKYLLKDAAAEKRLNGTSFKYIVSFANSTIDQNSEDRNLGSLRFTRQFLESCEKSADINDRKLSGEIFVYHPKTGRDFKSFPVELNVNSPPPSIENPLLQLTAESGGKYVLCFYMPVLTDTVHAADTKTFVFNGSRRYFKNDPAAMYVSPDFSSQDPEFMTTYSGTLFPLESGGVQFDAEAPSGYRVFYYNTGVDFTEREVYYDISIIDDAGFENRIGVSNWPYKLSAPQINITEGSTVSAGEDSGTFALRISHSGIAASNTKSKPCGDVEVVYTVTKEGTPYKSGTIKVSPSSPGGVMLPAGKNYKIKTYAKKNYFIASDNTDVTFNISRSGVYYVSQNGTSTALGTKGDPLRTIQQAINDIDVQIDSFGVLTEGYTINLLTDITPDKSDTFTNETLVNIPKKDMDVKYTFNGVNGVKKIDAQRNAGSKGKILKVKCSDAENKTQIIMNDLILTGCYTDSKGGAVELNDSYDGYFIADFNNVTFEGNTVSGNDFNGGGAIYANGNNNDSSVVTLNKCLLKNNTTLGLANGGAVYATGGCSFHIKNTSIINNNCENKGGAIFYTANLVLEGTTITGNISNKGGAVYIYNPNNTRGATLKISGKNIITENKLSDDSEANIRLGNQYSIRQIISIAGSLAGSKIGISAVIEPAEGDNETANAPTVGHNLVFTTGYSTYNPGVVPSKYFIGDNFTVVSDNGEAALSVGGGSISNEIYEDIKFEIDRASVFYDFPDASWRTINVKAKLGGEEITLSSIKLKLLNKGDLVKESGTSTIVVDRDFLIDDSYVLQVEGVYKGTTYRGNFDISYTKGDTFFSLTAPPTSGSYNIGSVESFVKFGNMVNSGATFDNVELYLHNDIVLPENFVMIGGANQSATNKFHGVLDGNGHSITIRSVASGTTSIFGLVENQGTVIRNIVIEGDVTTSGNFYGLCNYLDSKARIENCINRCNITSTEGHAAGFSGRGNNGAVFINCRNEAAISGKNYVGGLVADCSNAKFDGCVNTGNITAAENYAGGITGNLFGSIVNSVNTGNVQAQNFAGGICGFSNSTSSNGDGIVNCYNSGSVVAAESCAGGILGVAGLNTENTLYHFALVKNCFNCGQVSAGVPSTVYGIIAYINSEIETKGIFNNNYYLTGCVPEGQSGCAGIADSSGKFSASANMDDAITNLNNWVTLNPTFRCSGQGNFTLKQWRLVDGVIDFVE